LASTGILLIGTVGWSMLAAFVRKSNTWWGDTLEDVVMLPRDAWCSFPWLVSGIILLSLVGSGGIQVVLIGSLVLFPRALGVMREAYYFPQVGKNWLATVLQAIPVMVLFVVAGGILFTSTIGFLGLGIGPPFPEFGNMLSESFHYISTRPWLEIWPGIMLVLLLWIWVVAGDTLSERLGFRSKAIWSKMME
jgi:peptide/nickel transport system permease protein